ncbi:hypothetical protein HDU82_005545, partial [Entophlyctis luteolus]
FVRSKGADEVSFDITYKPFQLDSSLPKPGMKKIDHYVEKFGAGRAKQMLAHTKQLGDKEGIAFADNGVIGNTLDSHRLIKYAGQISHEAQNTVLVTLYRSYFEQGKDLSDPEVLVDAARAAGLDEAVVRTQICAGDLLLKETLADVRGAQRDGIQGVPNFVFDGKYQVSGAQESETFLRLFEKLAE